MPFNNTSASLVDGAPTSVYPVDHGYLSWSYDPVHAAGTYTLATSGTVYIVMLKVLPRLVSNIVVDMTTAGGTLTSGQNFAALYQNNALIAQTADQSTAWAGSTGVLTMALSSPVNVSQGNVYVALVSNGTTKPTFAAAAATTRSEALNVGLSSPNLRFASANTSVTTTLPATLGAQTALAAAPWVALS